MCESTGCFPSLSEKDSLGSAAWLCSTSSQPAYAVDDLCEIILLLQFEVNNDLWIRRP
jgi:hypothetical protein